MRRTRLNLVTLNERYRTGSPSGMRARSPFSEEGPPLSRRRLMKMAGVAALGLTPAVRTVGPALLGRLEMTGNRRRVTFILGGRERWVVDVRRFAGSPKLSVSRSNELIRVELRDARFPGTNLPADFECRIRRGMFGCRMTLTMALGGFRAELPFERWLVGIEDARSQIDLDLQACRLGADTSLALSGRSHASFRPSWQLRLEGNGLARIDGLGESVTADDLEIALAPEAEPSLLEQHHARRTCLALTRGDRTWRIEPKVAVGAGWRVGTGSTFDAITIEAAESRSGTVRHVLLAEADDARPRLFYAPGGAVDSDGRAFRLPLMDAAYALAFGPGEEHVAVTARHSSDPLWMHTDGYSLEVNGAPDVPFELTSFNGRVERAECFADIRRVNLPLAGALVEPSELPPGSRVHFVPDSPYVARPLIENIKKIEPYKVPQPDQPKPTSPVPFPANFMVTVIRPSDLLVLRFEFINLQFRSGGDSPRLVRAAANQTAYIIVHFQPQNIAEQAFFETANSDEGYTQPVGPGKPGYEKNFNASDTPAPPPVKARMAGRSRLAFRLPQGMNEIAYTLDALLDWTKFEPSLVPVALPPPPPPIQVYLSPVGGLTLKNPTLDKAKIGSIRSGKESLYRAGVKSSTSPNVADVSRKMTYEVDVDQSVQQSAVAQLNKADKGGAVIGTDRIQSIAGLVAQKPKDGFLGGIAIEGLLELFTIREPHPYETALETPYRLIISPNRFGAWAHSTSPVTLTTTNPQTNVTTERTELWHTRLGVRRTGTLKDGETPVDEITDYYRTIRAVWSPDYNRSHPPLHFDSTAPPSLGNPFRMSLDALDRHELVTLTSDFAIEDAEDRIVRADRLMLSSLGAWMNVRGGWEVPKKYPAGVQPLSVEDWRHRATMGRDHYVRVVYKGYLFPFGHRASLIKVTERKFHKTGSYMTAYLRQRMFIVVRQPLKEYPAYGQENDARDFPFRSLRITTLITPNLDKPELDAIAGKGQSAFWPHVAGPPFQFHLIGQDWEGRTTEFTAPLLFIDNTVAQNTVVTTAAKTDYDAKTDRSKRDLNGQKIAFASSKKPGDTALPTASITFTAFIPPESGGTTTANLLLQDQPRFYPAMKQSEVEVESIKQVAGLAGAVAVKYPTNYVQKGFAGNAGDPNGNSGQVFAEMVNGAVGLVFGGGGAGTDKVGGLSTPNMNISGLSRLSGPVSGDLSKMTQGVFNVIDFFQGLDVELLGGISLFDIVEAVTGFDLSLSNLKDQLESQLADAADKITSSVLDALPKCPVPAFVTQTIYEAVDAAASAAEKAEQAVNKIPKEIQITFKWDPEVKTFGPFVVKGDKKDTFSMTAVILVPLTGKSPSFAVNAWLKNFAIDLFEVIVVTFDQVKFSLDGGAKAKVDPKIKAVEFGGPLGFINELKDLLSFGDMFKIDLLPTGVTLTVSIGLPDVAVGAFSLMNINLGASLTIPFTGDPVRFRFHFCERESPFRLTVYIFGGGGFFAIELGMDGLELLEAALEFGVSASMSIGVASGSVSVMAGIYFKLEKTATGDKTTLTGYVRMNGSMNILGLITVSVEFYLSLTWESGPPDKVWGEAKLTIEIEILFFSISVSLSVRKEFVDPPPPKLPEVVTADEWVEYRRAFAA